ncbi:Hypothetical predicted protein [Paramuricea clavata]|uniref:Uncharacterized protein n=1 Tax=Paramuricea clavata TaxID=317549 RepID=A0A7D9HQE3_PARCT|nr:Hypothetical predicted protein [Paramuricea clavata]
MADPKLASWIPWSKLTTTNEQPSRRRLFNMNKNSTKDEDLKQEYEKIIDDQPASGVIEKAPDEPLGERVYYMPHKPVVRQELVETTTTSNSHNMDGDGSDPAGNDLEPSPKRVRMERQEQEIVILSVRAKITSQRASTSARRCVALKRMASNSSEIPDCCCVCLSGEPRGEHDIIYRHQKAVVGYIIF